MSQMLSETLQRPVGGDPVYFSPKGYFVGIAKDVVASQSNMRIELPGNGTVVMLPGRHEYYASVPNMVEFCQTSAKDFKKTPLKNDTADDFGRARHIGELLWQAAFHASQGRLIESASNGEAVHIYDVIRFTSWPNLTRLPKTANTMRICALLTRHPSSIMLVSRKLGIESEEVFQVYSAACSSGIVNVISNHMGRADTQAGVEDVEIEHGQEHGLLHSLFAKISGL